MNSGSSPPQLAASAFERLVRAGVGGAAEVWKARTPEGVLVALKIARDDDAREALAREASHALLALSPRLPALVDVGFIDASDDDQASPGVPIPFVALRWVEGRSLRDWMRERVRDRASAALQITHDVAEAIADLHAIGLAHGDLKPENIVVDEHDRAHVIDLGLSARAYETTVEGATPRYLASGDADLGDGRARDLVALGIVIAELVDDGVSCANVPIDAARNARLPPPFDSICTALLTKNPGARPTALWVAETARSSIGAQTIDTSSERADRDARRVRATYLSIRSNELASHAIAGKTTVHWLDEAIGCLRRARALRANDVASSERAPSPIELGPLDPDGITRWLTALVGSAAIAWPVASLSSVDEAMLGSALERLARHVPPEAWTFADVEAAVLGKPEAPRLATRSRDSQLDKEDVARLALAISFVPPNQLAIQRVEQQRDAPPALVIAAADALRRLGQFGRARHLVLRARDLGASGADALAAEILRRAGDIDGAREIARAAIQKDDADHASRAVLARIAYDQRRLEEAESLVTCASCSPAEEVAALIASERGQKERAMTAIRRGEAIARSDEQRARLSAIRGYVEHGVDPAAAQRAFATAVDHAARAGAVIEEATYRTGEAAAAVDVGDLGAALSTSRRAALLWEHLGRPAHAARALLAMAAAYETAGARHDAVRVAREAIVRAREGRDTRAEAYALWAIADASLAGSDEGRRAAERARELLRDAGSDDTLRADARLVEHAPRSLARETYEVRDAMAESAAVQPGARLDWIRARAESLLSGDEAPNARVAERLLAALVGLSDARAPIAARGPALAAGYSLAARLGRGDIALRLLASLGDAARDLLARAPAELAPTIRSLAWVSQAALVPQEGLHHEQARELERLIVALSERERLRPLLDRVVDALVLWTGVERGLLLLCAPQGRLVPRAARNLARADLRGEQIALSHTLAQRALAALEPVVAVDAAGELPSVHQSVHALKLRSVLAVPLVARGEALGVVYLDDRVRKGAFGPRELAWTRAVASIAALAIADARAQVLLTRAARQAKRATAKLEETLARREAALDVAERELGRTRSSRETRFKYEAIVGESECMREMLRLVDRVTMANVPVLVQGESGSGKELIARAIHFNGPRSNKPFVSENCSAIPETLLESALFGHVRGAFTGADKPRLGLFDAADRGTLFLDEVGEMSLPMQAKLLRVLEDGLVRPLGTERTRKVDVRIIAATHRDIEAMVRARTFREDLFYRLNIIVVRVPPLRDRASDVPLIVKHLLAKYDRPNVRVTRAAMDRLMSYAWPGNVRQIENEIRRALVLCDDMIDREHLSPEIANVTPAVPVDLGLNVRPRVDALEVQLVREALERTRGNQTQAAKLLGLSRFGLQKMMKRLNVVA
ncbi:MAG: sigma 54-interacting transcriptional regulator [Polyangiaceae bacterium]|nr:sigma 54-interacting transcriptional regulator [Polyangiaceae bacterium]